MIMCCPPGFQYATTNSGDEIYKHRRHSVWVYKGDDYRIYVPSDYDVFETPFSGRMYTLHKEEYDKVLAFLELI